MLRVLFHLSPCGRAAASFGWSPRAPLPEGRRPIHGRLNLSDDAPTDDWQEVTGRPQVHQPL